ncbi:LOW QUALITY PROTEIN: hypothetical protein V2J09_021192 [Rumex salicifolius]
MGLFTLVVTLTDFVDDLGLLDTGFSGQPFTWSHGSSAAGHVAKRLDRVFMSIDPFVKWPSASTPSKVRLRPHSLALRVGARSRARNFRRPILFEAMWLTHPGFRDFIRDSWRGDVPANEARRFLKHKLLIWNKIVFGDVRVKKSSIVALIEDLQCQIQVVPSDAGG